MEEAVGNHGSDRRAADYVVTIEIAAEEAVVEVVGHAVIVNRTDVVRDVHVVAEVVVVRVHIRYRLRRGTSSRVSTVVLRSSLRTSLSVACITSLGVVFGSSRCCRGRGTSVLDR